MGLTSAVISISNLYNSKLRQTDNFLVDSGASLTVVPENIWKKLKIKPESEVFIHLANGKVLKRKTGFAKVKYLEKEVPTQVILGESDDSKLLGVLTLEEMGLILNPLKRTLEQNEIRM
ncbi:hypothetical protein A3D77_01125 [Candidatus Gottesmanbacteria bacterium RIFCSPHIGHO2_02_FULL_39_11]|uniref:Peptidase A2 domain-containing protein n=1 Tax=Candidatus Gottesmanbacteria bacterium RIFCSPHIGHO2_02_FULL_39_11 TaxID=1798382 RepID=A0A1F5ZKA3_9BACT|nr:MAG: hypothetical protein A3D77_01125 [Candidatus Gottesmanbacteria bacterium RIFCSPHIGHO2_02_FULL_39_11]